MVAPLAQPAAGPSVQLDFQLLWAEKAPKSAGAAVFRSLARQTFLLPNMFAGGCWLRCCTFLSLHLLTAMPVIGQRPLRR